MAPSTRADVVRNRAQLLAAARAELSDLTHRRRAEGGATRLSLESVARRAGVGVGTVYRHFGDRTALVEAVYRDELTELAATASDDLDGAGRLPGDRALLAWLHRYADFVDAKRALGDDFAALVTSGVITVPQTRAELAGAVSTLLAAGAADRTLRGDVSADDVVAAMAGAIMAAVGEPPRAQIDRLLGLLVDGLRPR